MERYRNKRKTDCCGEYNPHPVTLCFNRSGIRLFEKEPSPRNVAKHTWKCSEDMWHRFLRTDFDGFSRKKTKNTKRPLRGNFANNAPIYKADMKAFKRSWADYRECEPDVKRMVKEEQEIYEKEIEKLEAEDEMYMLWLYGKALYEE